MTDFEALIRRLVAADIRFVLIRLKRAAGRPRDLLALAELEALLEEQGRDS